VLKHSFRAAPARGFSLVEMMISLVLGLIVVGAALTLVVSIVRANSETVQATQLTSDLRAVLGLVTKEVQRARYMSDPLTNVGLEDLAVNPNNVIDDDTAGCIRFSYYDADPNRDGSTADAANRAVAIRRNVVNGVGGIYAVAENVAVATVPATLPACTAATIRLSSPEVDITAFNPRVIDDVDADADGIIDAGQEDSLIAIDITGAMVNDRSGLAITRTVSERLRVGSSRLR
jgi:prepilin-type N-terminal cleavage/methylation domain-containing protein